MIYLRKLASSPLVRRSLPNAAAIVTQYFQFRRDWSEPISSFLVRETLGYEESITIGDRLCLVSPSLCKLQRLAFLHVLYHCCRNDSECIDSQRRLSSPAVVQKRASEFARHARHLIS